MVTLAWWHFYKLFDDVELEVKYSSKGTPSGRESSSILINIVTYPSHPTLSFKENHINAVYYKQT